MKQEDKINQALEKNVEKIYPSKEGLKKLLLAKKVRLYLGIDPTATRLHLGHTIPIRKLAEFANLGHKAILLFGTGTVLVGDPSERKTGRKLITQKEINKNIATWKKQVKPFVNFKKLKTKSNGDWLTLLTLTDIIKIASKISAVQLFKRDSFTRRIKEGNTVWYHETLYPLLQGYDSVVMNVDLEIGGTDQTFNMLIGRQLQRKMNNKEKYVLTLKMIPGADGKPMSKTSGNCIWLTDSAKNIYGKIMSINDNLIPQYFEAFTDMNPPELKSRLKNLKTNPMRCKKELAFIITKQIRGEKQTLTAQEEFKKVFQSRGVPLKIKTFSISKLSVNPIKLANLLTETGLAKSKSIAKNLIKQNAVSINNKLKTKNSKSTVKPNMIVNIGKRKWIKLK